ncbi:MAG TPA: hypothetical protein DCE42_07905 [Myxococcales bacterium]|nr:hypothetical protein [Deltaproteobacteria bacterium]MBU50712.1 hypothetical protein [Deltaproteobacteria bacterium]HAA54667.1 hypothetical protein [Myxococcales bacterium]
MINPPLVKWNVFVQYRKIHLVTIGLTRLYCCLLGRVATRLTGALCLPLQLTRSACLCGLAVHTSLGFSPQTPQCYRIVCVPPCGGDLGTGWYPFQEVVMSFG